LTGLILAYQGDLPQIETLEDYRPSIITEIYSGDSTVIGEFAVEKRIIISIKDLPDIVKQAFIAAEDKRFYHHPGIDVFGIARAFIKNQIKGRIVGGGSTITQQLARDLFLTPSRTYGRKLKEAVLAFQIEKHYTKDEILNLYANQVFLGHGKYGWEAAAQFYFGKQAKNLALGEAALLAGLTSSPNRYSPYVDPEAALSRRSYVLERMLDEGYITEEEARTASETPLELRQRGHGHTFAPYFVEEVRRYLQQRYGTRRVYRDGLRVYTTLNVVMQRAAEKALDKALRDLDKRRGFRGACCNLNNEGCSMDLGDEDSTQPLESGQFVYGVISQLVRDRAQVRVGRYSAVLDKKSVAWTGASRVADILDVGDVVQLRIGRVDPVAFTMDVTLEQEPDVEGAFLAVDSKSGQIKAMVGGLDFSRSEFNRATQALRQPGSAFKPFVYAAAIESGFTPRSLILDAPVQYETPGADQEFYVPTNYDGKYEGWITLRRAFEASRNVPAVKITEQIGVQKVAEMARRLGLSGSMPPYLSLPLGSAEVTLLEMVSAYSAFPHQGVRMRPYIVTKITDRDGNILEENHPKTASAIRADTAYIMTSLMKGVVERGTAVGASRLGRPLGGKTGTTNDYTDAWFIGFDPRICAGVWVGFDQNQTLGSKEVGARAALPAWIDFMEEVLAHQPVEDFPIPSNIVFVPIDRHSGYPAWRTGSDVITETFIAGTEPDVYRRYP
jgi:penicillin-binding protein 1A